MSYDLPDDILDHFEEWSAIIRLIEIIRTVVPLAAAAQQERAELLMSLRDADRLLGHYSDMIDWEPVSALFARGAARIRNHIQATIARYEAK